MKTLLSTIVLAALAATAANADIEVLLDNAAQSGSANDTLSFFGTITNTSSDSTLEDAIYLNSDSLNLSLADATVSDNFLSNVPLYLAGGQSSGDIDLFDLTLGADPAGVYTGQYSLFGGADQGANIATGLLASANFTVTETSPPVPEPGTITMLAGALGFFAFLRFTRAGTSRLRYVAHALLRAASALVPTPGAFAKAGVEKSLDTAR
jgi:hypothetical protein